MKDAAGLERMALEQDQRISEVVKREQSRLRNFIRRGCCRPITFWQALGILALCRILFGGFGRRSFYRSNFRRILAERWEHMTTEERERFRQGMRGRCGFGP